MISLLISLLIICLIFGVIWWALGQFSLPDPIGNIVRVIVVVVFALVLINLLMGLTGAGINLNLR